MSLCGNPKCGCECVLEGDIYTRRIKYCPLHKAAPKLYEALLATRDYIRARMSDTVGKEDQLKIIDKAIAGVEDK